MVKYRFNDLRAVYYLIKDNGIKLDDAVKQAGLPKDWVNNLDKWGIQYLSGATMGRESSAVAKKNITDRAATGGGPAGVKERRDLSNASEGDKVNGLRKLLHDGDISFEDALEMLNLPENYILDMKSWGLRFIADGRSVVLDKEIDVSSKISLKKPKMDFRDFIAYQEKEEKQEEIENSGGYIGIKR
ncbi:MAG: hypothetical protein LBQ86_07970 [Holophagales bacterium]|jgi:hypothetical protein|nr:hypothetical protein [Holophagales bacterium]